MKVAATAAPIRVGDLLVTSDKEGIVMRSQPLHLGPTPIHRPGTPIGKALEPLEKASVRFWFCPACNSFERGIA